MLTKFYEHALNQLRLRKREYITQLANGFPQTFDHYKFLCGKINGLLEAEEMLIDLFDRMQNTKNLQDEKKSAELY